MDNGFWTPERVDILTTSWASGQFASEIGSALGCTRNAVIGKVDRLGLGITQAERRKRMRRCWQRIHERQAADNRQV